MGQLKRRRPHHLLRPDQMLATLASLRLHALLQHGGIWLAVPPEMSELLNQCCTGQLDGGPGTADEVAAVLAPLVGEPQLPPGMRTAAAAAAAAAEVTSDGTPAADATAEAAQQQQQPQPLDPIASADGRVNGVQPMEVDASPQQQQQQQSVSAATAVDPWDGPTRAADPWGGPAPAVDPWDGPGPAIDQGDCDDVAAASSVGDGVTVAEGEAGKPGPAEPASSALPNGTEHGGPITPPVASERPQAAGDASAGACAVGPLNPEAELPAAAQVQVVEAAVGDASVAAAATAVAGGRGGGGGDAPKGGRGRRCGGGGGRGRGHPPYTPAAAGCRLVAVRLTLEEAFFLHYVLRCVEVYELQPESHKPATAEHVRLLDTEALWRACRSIRSNFVTSYAAYHHLKSKGWIPRSGLLYGVDFVVYQLHPVGAHSDFGVLVMPLGSGPGGSSGSGGPHAPALSWLDLQITNRLINQVVKKLVLLYLYERPGHDHMTPRCLSNFAVEERIVRRWVPDATRD